jgi:MoaA/NifB/PqqE/SkfB family radical SAM enzyme
MSDFYCAAPWRGLHINFRGDVKTCCAGDPNMLGDLNHHSIEEILSSSVMQDIRESIRNGKPHDYCSNCVKAERYGRSERHWHNDVNPNFDPATADLLEHQPVIVDVRWNITCNLSCNYCGPYCSSKWAALMKFDYQNGVRSYYDQVCDYIEQHKHSVKEVALVGGEPLLLEENQRLLDVIPTDCTVTLITNMNVNFDTNRIVQKLQQRNNVGWSMSFDNVGERFEYVRHGGQWTNTDANVRRVMSFMQQHRHWGGIHAVYNLYNCTRLCELREYADSVGANIMWQTLYQPEYLDPGMHSFAVRELAVREIDRYFSKFVPTEQEQQFFQAVRKRMLNQEHSGSLVKSLFIAHINDIETKYHKQSRGQFQSLWPELHYII